MMGEQDKKSANLDDEIERVMAQAEAAVGEDAPDADDGDVIDVDPEPAAGASDAAADTGAPGGASDAGSDPSEEVERLREELTSTKDKWLRAVADLENQKKRVKREMDEAVVRAMQDVLGSFLPTVDNLERALEAAPASEDASALVKGITMVRDEFLVSLKRHGIEAIDSVGHAFDPAVHDALQQVDSDDHAPGTVIREFEKGYRRGERLLRPARVIVASPNSKGDSAAGES